MQADTQSLSTRRQWATAQISPTLEQRSMPLLRRMQILRCAHLNLAKITKRAETLHGRKEGPPQPQNCYAQATTIARPQQIWDPEDSSLKTLSPVRTRTNGNAPDTRAHGSRSNRLRSSTATKGHRASSSCIAPNRLAIPFLFPHPSASHAPCRPHPPSIKFKL
jgi:hypothetical protein